jgi:hypothetical protein
MRMRMGRGEEAKPKGEGGSAKSLLLLADVLHESTN